MKEKSNIISIFDEYEDLYKLTSNIADEHIEFYKTKNSKSTDELFKLWRRLSAMADNFDKRQWTENWHNWHKNYQGFERHKLEGKFLIQHFLTDVLEELLAKTIHNFSEGIEAYASKVEREKPTQNDSLSELIKNEVKRQITLELANQKKKPKKNIQTKKRANLKK